MSNCVYSYRGSLYCQPCGEKIRAEITKAGKAPHEGHTYTTSDFPKGPFEVGKSDVPEYCGRCRKFLENPLSDWGREFVREAIADAVKDGCSDSEALKVWAPFYDIAILDGLS